mmetsp:Transcript_39304/g.108405  ORF Transcript_39304/g.108405 Transcript_39304/m.108405 type:complete len:845 (+) Transcript_39304:3-2537(+)
MGRAFGLVCHGVLLVALARGAALNPSGMRPDARVASSLVMGCNATATSACSSRDNLLLQLGSGVPSRSHQALVDRRDSSREACDPVQTRRRRRDAEMCSCRRRSGSGGLSLGWSCQGDVIQPCDGNACPIGWASGNATSGTGLWCEVGQPSRTWDFLRTCPTGLSATTVKVLSYNLGESSVTGGVNGMAAAKIAAASPPDEYDILGFQDSKDVARLMGEAADRGLSGEYGVLSEALDQRALGIAYRTSRWIVNSSGWEDVGEDSPWAYIGKRAAQWARLQHSSGLVVFFVNHHGPQPISAKGTCVGSATAYNIMRVIAENAHPGDALILVGDFNAQMHSSRIRVLDDFMHRVFTGTPMGGVDHIYSNCVGDAVSSTTSFASGGIGHDALSAIFRIPSPAPKARCVDSAISRRRRYSEMCACRRRSTDPSDLPQGWICAGNRIVPESGGDGSGPVVPTPSPSAAVATQSPSVGPPTCEGFQVRRRRRDADMCSCRRRSASFDLETGWACEGNTIVAVSLSPAPVSLPTSTPTPFPAGTQRCEASQIRRRRRDVDMCSCRRRSASQGAWKCSGGTMVVDETYVNPLPSTSASERSIRFMSYNVMGWSACGRRRRRAVPERGVAIFEKIARWDPAVLGAQEVETGGGQGYASCESVIMDNTGLGAGLFNNSVLEKDGDSWTPLTGGYWLAGARYKHKASGAYFLFFNSHWKHGYGMDQAKTVATAIQAEREKYGSPPTLLVGDFNQFCKAYELEAYQYLTGESTDYTGQTSPVQFVDVLSDDKGRSFGPGDCRVDFILATVGQWSVVQATIDRDGMDITASDHAALMAELVPTASSQAQAEIQIVDH